MSVFLLMRTNSLFKTSFFPCNDGELRRTRKRILFTFNVVMLSGYNSNDLVYITIHITLTTRVLLSCLGILSITCKSINSEKFTRFICPMKQEQSLKFVWLRVLKYLPALASEQGNVIGSVHMCTNFFCN